MKRHKILVIAEAANPEWVSVPLVGWSHAYALRRVADVHMVTQVRNQAAIERFGWTEGREFTAIDSEALAKALWKVSELLRGGSGKGWTVVTALQAPSYLYFEHLFWKKFEAELRAGKWDAVHRVTPLSPSTPSLLARRLKRLGIPYVVGPLNGGVPWPKEFDAERRAEKEWLSRVRGAHRFMPGYSSLRKYAAALIVGSSRTVEQMPSWCRNRCVYIPENAVDPERFQAEEPSAQATESADAAPSGADGSEEPRPLKIAFVGRLVPCKGIDMLLDACAPLLSSGAVKLQLIGDGPELGKLKEHAQKLGVEEYVEFAGWVPHEKVQEFLAPADILGFPSIREFGGGVVLEAMALGVVPLVVAYGGPKELVTADTGIAVPLGPRSQIVSQLRSAVEGLAQDRKRLAALSLGSRKRVAEYFTWSQKAEQMAQVYDWVLGEGPKPDFGMPLGAKTPSA